MAGAPAPSGSGMSYFSRSETFQVGGASASSGIVSGLLATAQRAGPGSTRCRRPTPAGLPSDGLWRKVDRSRRRELQWRAQRQPWLDLRRRSERLLPGSRDQRRAKQRLRPALRTVQEGSLMNATSIVYGAGMVGSRLSMAWRIPTKNSWRVLARAALRPTPYFSPSRKSSSVRRRHSCACGPGSATNHCRALRRRDLSC